MSDDQNINDVAPLEDNESHAVSEQSTDSQEDKLYAGKFKSPEDMEKSYLNLEKEYSRAKSSQPRNETTEEDPLAEVAPILNEWAKSAGLVSRAELEAEKREEENFNLYLTSNPSAKARADKIKVLAQSDVFKGKSYEEIDKFLAGGESSAHSGKPVKMGSTPRDNGFEGENSPDELSDFFKPKK